MSAAPRAPRPAPPALAVVLAALALPFVLAPADWGAWALLYGAVALAWLDPALRDDPPAGIAVAVTAAAHGLIALANSMAGPLPGAELDAALFKAHGIDLALYEPLRLEFGSGLFENALAAVHTLFGVSPLLGDAAAVFAFTLAAVFFARLLQRLGVARYRGWLVLAFGLWPSSLLVGSVTLREPFQLLAFTAMVYWALLPATGVRRIGALAAAAAAGVALGALHAAMLAYAAAALVLLALWPAARGGGGWRAQLPALALLAAVGGGVALTLPQVHIRSGDNLFAVAQRDLVQGLQAYRAGVASAEPRTAFGAELSFESVPAFAVSLGHVYVHYLFAPFPWRIGDARDVIAAAESLLRLALIAALAGLLWRGGGAPRRVLAVLALLYLGITLTWTLGTTNYGQALRHHVLSNWLLLATGGPVLAGVAHRALARMLPRTVRR